MPKKDLDSVVQQFKKSTLAADAHFIQMQVVIVAMLKMRDREAVKRVLAEMGYADLDIDKFLAADTMGKRLDCMLAMESKDQN